MLDLLYYSLLLDGAVDAIIELERRYPEVQLSTRIRETVGFGVKAPWFAYAIVWFPLVGFTIWSWFQHKLESARCDICRTRQEFQL